MGGEIPENPAAKGPGVCCSVIPECDLYTRPIRVARASFSEGGRTGFSLPGLDFPPCDRKPDRRKPVLLSQKQNPQTSSLCYLKPYALCALNIFISSAEGPYMPGISTLF